MVVENGAASLVTLPNLGVTLLLSRIETSCLNTGVRMPLTVLRFQGYLVY